MTDIVIDSRTISIVLPTAGVAEIECSTGVPGVGVASGGTGGQVLTKTDDTNYNTEWADGPAAANGIPVGGTADQVLAKIDAVDYNAEWVDAAGGGGTGDVVGPASAVDENLAAFDTTTGKLIKDSLVPLSWFDQSLLEADSPTFTDLHLGIAEGDSSLYFYDGASPTGQSLMWDDSAGWFELSAGLYTGGSSASDGNIYLNYGGPDGNSLIYFYDGTSTTGQSLLWDDDPGEFVLSADLLIGATRFSDLVTHVDGDGSDHADVATNTTEIKYATSPMLVTGGGFSTGTNTGTLKVAAITAAVLRTTASEQGTLEIITVAETDNLTMTTPDTQSYFVVVTYGASGTSAVSTTTTTPNGQNIIAIGTCMRETDNTVHWNEGGFSLADGIAKTHKRIKAAHGIEVVSGGAITDESSLEFSIAAVKSWAGLNELTTFSGGFDTTVGGGDTFRGVYSDGGSGFTYVTAQTTIDDQHFDDGDGTLGDIGNNQYGVYWFYAHASMDMLFVRFGEASYLLPAAEAAQPPANNPLLLSGFGVLLAKVIVQKDAGVIAEIQYATDDPFSGTAASPHNDLTGLNEGDYQHLTAANATDLTDAGDSTLHYHNADRARAVHTGEQAASTISDFDTEVGNHTDVTDNTSARHDESHTVVSHSDTTATGANLTELTDSSETTLHSHAGGGDTYSTVTGDSGTVSASGTETLHIDGGDGIVTAASAATPDQVAVTLDVNNLTPEATPASGDFFVMYDATATAHRKVDYDNMPGAGGGDPDQNLWETIAGDTGSTAADSITDILTIAGGTGITTAMSGDTLTVTATAGGGNVSNTGTPADNQVAVWTDATTVEGTSGLTYDGTDLTITGNIVLDGTVDGIDIFTDVPLNTLKDTNVSTDLSEGTSNETTVDVNSSDGTNATLVSASATRAGLLTKAKWDEIVVNSGKAANVSTALTLAAPTATTVPINSDGASPDITLIEATTTTAGLLGADKWDEIVANTAHIGTVTGNPHAIDITDLSTYAHNSLTDLDTGDYQHLTAADNTDLTDGNDSTLHYHATDRTRSNHTGSQPATTMSGDLTLTGYQAVGLEKSVQVSIDGGGSVITAGKKIRVEVDTDMTIQSVRLFADASGTIAVDINKSTYSGYPTTASICASAIPSLSSAQKSEDTTLTAWTVTLTKGDVLEFEVDASPAPATVTKVTVSLLCVRR